ncbi:hypothetical protein Pelo_5140 [Pelomyxa schiedti]|nr:hypothetical protein Pelo_5140 [Pelomyxa schiedti]
MQTQENGGGSSSGSSMFAGGGVLAALSSLLSSSSSSTSPPGVPQSPRLADVVPAPPSPRVPLSPPASPMSQASLLQQKRQRAPNASSCIVGCSPTSVLSPLPRKIRRSSSSSSSSQSQPSSPNVNITTCPPSPRISSCANTPTSIITTTTCTSTSTASYSSTSTPSLSSAYTRTLRAPLSPCLYNPQTSTSQQLATVDAQSHSNTTSTSTVAPPPSPPQSQLPASPMCIPIPSSPVYQDSPIVAPPSPLPPPLSPLTGVLQPPIPVTKETRPSPRLAAAARRRMGKTPAGSPRQMQEPLTQQYSNPGTPVADFNSAPPSPIVPSSPPVSPSVTKKKAAAPPKHKKRGGSIPLPHGFNSAPSLSAMDATVQTPPTPCPPDSPLHDLFSSVTPESIPSTPQNQSCSDSNLIVENSIASPAAPAAFSTVANSFQQADTPSPARHCSTRKSNEVQRVNITILSEDLQSLQAAIDHKYNMQLMILESRAKLLHEMTKLLGLTLTLARQDDIQLQRIVLDQLKCAKEGEGDKLLVLDPFVTDNETVGTPYSSF